MKMFHKLNISFLNIKIYLLLILIITYFENLKAEEIGFIGKIEGNVKSVVFLENGETKEKDLFLYDVIALNEEIKTESNSNIIIQYKDNSTIKLKSNSQIKVEKFNLDDEKKFFNIVIDNGSASIETGFIAKSQGGSMEVKTPGMTIGISGTRFNIENESDGTFSVSLAEDSFGKVGSVNISSEDSSTTLFNPDQVISINNRNEILKRSATEEEKKDLQNISSEIIETSKIDEGLIQKSIERKLLSGSLEDINNDGVVDFEDVIAITENIKLEKVSKINYIVDNIDEENVFFLSEVLNGSDQKNIGEALDNVLNNKSKILDDLVSDLAANDNPFITEDDVSNDLNVDIKKRVFDQMITEGSDRNIEVLSKVISKSSIDRVETLVNRILIQNEVDQDSNLSLKILSNLVERESVEFNEFDEDKDEQVERLIEKSFLILSSKSENLDSDDETFTLMTNVMARSNTETLELMIDNIVEVNAENTGTNLSLKILNNLVSQQSLEMNNFDIEQDEQVDRLIERTFQEIADSNETDTSSIGDDNESLNLVSNLIIQSDIGILEKIVDEIVSANQQNTSSKISLKVLTNLVDNESSGLSTMNNEEDNQVERLMEMSFESVTAEDTDDVAALSNIVQQTVMYNKPNIEKLAKIVSDSEIGNSVASNDYDPVTTDEESNTSYTSNNNNADADEDDESDSTNDNDSNEEANNGEGGEGANAGVGDGDSDPQSTDDDTEESEDNANEENAEDSADDDEVTVTYPRMFKGNMYATESDYNFAVADYLPGTLYKGQMYNSRAALAAAKAVGSEDDDASPS